MKILAKDSLQDIAHIHVENSQELLELAQTSFAWSRNHKSISQRFKKSRSTITVSTVNSEAVKVLSLTAPCFPENQIGATRNVVVDFQSCLAFVYIHEIQTRELTVQGQQCKMEWARDMILRGVLLPRTVRRFKDAIIHEVNIWSRR